MKHTNKNHKRRNNKKRQTKKYKRVGGDGEEKEEKGTGWFNTFSEITNRIRGTPSDGNSTGLNAEAERLFNQLKSQDAENNKYLTQTEYEKNNISNMPDFETVAGDDIKVYLNKFTAAYYFAKVKVNDDKTLNEDEYKKLQKLLPDKFGSVEYNQVDKKNDNGIDFNEFLEQYNKPKTGGRRRRKRSTCNNRKSNKKRRTVKRRKSAKKSRRRK